MTAMGGDVVVADAPGGGADFQLRVCAHNESDGQSSPRKLAPDSTKNRKMPQLPWFLNSGPARVIRSVNRS
jgi:hypothetical protein